MKFCPQCNKTYADDSLKFCLQDGKVLEYIASRFDPQADTLKFSNSSIPVQRNSKGRNILLWMIAIVIVGLISLILWLKLNGRSNGDTSVQSSPSTESADSNKIAGIGLVSNDIRSETYDEGYLLKNSQMTDSSDLLTRIQFLDLALYRNNKAYIKVSICNEGAYTGELYELYLWYTSSNSQDSINWHFLPTDEVDRVLKRKPLMDLKPNECKVIGWWSEGLGDSFQLQRPLGKIYISDRKGYPSVSINLGQADSKGLIKF